MLKRILLSSISAALILTTSYASAAPKNQFLFAPKQPKHIEVNNRIMAIVNGKPITAYDIMKKLDLTFYKQYPEYADSIESKFQYYRYNWKYTLQDLVDKELILAEAEELKVPINSGEVRQEMETLFGPNIIHNLDRIGMTFDEAHEMVQSDLLLQRMMSMRVNLKSMRKVTPQAILQAYEEYCKENIRLFEWDYSIISVRNPDESKAAEVSNVIHRLVTEDNVPMTEIKERLKALGLIDKDTKINISNKFHHNEKEVSEMYKEVLLTMKADSYTEPLAHTSRNGKSKIFRIFYLEDVVKGGKIPFEEVENKLIQQIRTKFLDEETANYLNKLRQHFRVDEKEVLMQLPSDFEPFSLK
ncbi:MAG: peptidyl-prolyl cis-trans isomerase [Chlamydiota bacterium]|nr:peptidyl-prolyl cis-trans isomerase [Chlamydiota bacterium]